MRAQAMVAAVLDDGLGEFPASPPLLGCLITQPGRAPGGMRLVWWRFGERHSYSKSRFR